MEVELKKVKITLSVIKQLLPATCHQMESYTPLGWVVVKDGKYSKQKILLYNGNTNILTYCLLPKKIILNKRFYSDTEYKQIDWCTDFGTLTYNGDSEEDARQTKERFEKMVDKAKQIGQIFY